jgi:plastocyanin
MEPNTSGTGGSSKGLLIGVIIVIILIVAGITIWSFSQNTPTETLNINTNSDQGASLVSPVATSSVTSTTTKTTTPTTATSTTSTKPKTVTVTYNGTAFSPATTNINQGDTVKFVNNSSGSMWVASAPHPTHTDYPGFDEKASVGKGGSYSFTFTKVGSWKYHNHKNPSAFGTIVVK